MCLSEIIVNQLCEQPGLVTFSEIVDSVSAYCESKKYLSPWHRDFDTTNFDGTPKGVLSVYTERLMRIQNYYGRIGRYVDVLVESGDLVRHHFGTFNRKYSVRRELRDPLNNCRRYAVPLLFDQFDMKYLSLLLGFDRCGSFLKPFRIEFAKPKFV